MTPRPAVPAPGDDPVYVSLTREQVQALHDVAVFEFVSRDRGEIASFTNLDGAKWRKIRDALAEALARGAAWKMRAVAAEAEAERLRDGLRRLRERAEREPLATDVSDYGDEWCAGFLQGQANALDVACALPEDGAA